MSGGLVVTGATGFLGSFVTPLLVQRRRQVACVVRESSKVERLRSLGVELRVADLSDACALRKAFAGADTLVNLASLGFGHAPTLVQAARDARIQRAVFIGTTAIFTSLPARSRRARLEAEAWIQHSGLDYTLLRPTMIYGGAGDRNIARLLRRLARTPVIVVPGSGRALHQPVHARDAAGAVMAALERSDTRGKSYNLGGPRPVSFNEMLDTAADVLGRRVVRLHVPIGPAVVALRMAEALRIPVPIRAEQVLRLAEDKVVDIRPARRELGFEPIDFRTGVRQLAEELFGRHAT